MQRLQIEKVSHFIIMFEIWKSKFRIKTQVIMMKKFLIF